MKVLSSVPMENRYELNGITLGLGLLSNIGYSYLFFYVLYPLVMWKAGIVMGGLVMTALSAVVCYGAIIFYDRSGRDFMGIEAIKKATRDYDGASRIGRSVAWALKKSSALALVALSIKFDPFVTTVYMRPASHSPGGMTRGDWKVFIGSVLIGNGYWIFVMYAGGTVISGIKSIFF